MTKKQNALSYEAIVKALLENYESIYAVNVKTNEYRCFHQSDSYSSLSLSDHGDDFFDSLDKNIFKAIYYEDRDYVRKMLKKETLIDALNQSPFYTFIYRLMIDGKPLYHKLRATIDQVDGHQHILIGIRNVDAAFRQDKAQAEQLSSMHSKEINHLEAILASAEAYLEVNLSKDLILELSSSVSSKIFHQEPIDPFSYSTFDNWLIDNLVIENKKQFQEISDRNYLINCFMQGDKRASVAFSMKENDNDIKPCRIVFYLYQDETTKDILSFCVLYDLTEQQRKDKELKDLERELQLSRLRNINSQMQPHFLYNALGSIQEIILDNPTYASDLIGDFTIHLRSCIRAMANDTPIPFDQELANIKAYVNIEKMRFGDKLNLIYDIQTDNFSILPLTVQPLVENAIRHGIYEKGLAGGTVWISTKEDDDNYIIIVKDDGVGFDYEAYQNEIATGKRDSTGIKSIMFRLEKMMQAKVEITSIIGEGTIVTIFLPKENK